MLEDEISREQIVYYATREENKRFLSSVQNTRGEIDFLPVEHTILYFCRFQLKKTYSYACNSTCRIDYFQSIAAQLDKT